MGHDQKIRAARKQQRRDQQVGGERRSWMRRSLPAAITVLILGSILTFMFTRPATAPSSTVPTATLVTSRGEIVIELLKAAAPKTVENFVKLARQGLYNGLTFHRVIADFMIQGGDPKGDGTGGPGYSFADEINPRAQGLSDDAIAALARKGYQYDFSLPSVPVTVGVVAMANSGPATNGSQFFIVTTQDQPHLNGLHTVFGRVTAGLDVARNIQQGDTITRIVLSGI